MPKKKKEVIPDEIERNYDKLDQEKVEKVDQLGTENVFSVKRKIGKRERKFLVQCLTADDIVYLNEFDRKAPIEQLKESGNSSDFLRKHDVKPGDFLILGRNGVFYYSTAKLFDKLYTK